MLQFCGSVFISMFKEPKPCVICKREDSDRAHIKTRGAGAGNEDWEWLYLCRSHHQEQHRLGWHKFRMKHLVVSYELRIRGWETRMEFGVPKLRRIST